VRIKEQSALALFLLLLIGALLRTVILRESMAVPFLLGAALLPLLMMAFNYSGKAIGRTLIHAAHRFKTLFGIILLMGITIGLWLFSGAVPAMIYYSMGLISKLNLVLLCFLIPAGFSFIIGTALGTISTFGIALLAIGKSAGIAEGLLLGAIVSGAFMADRLSPVAGLVNLNLSAHGISYNAYLKASYKRVGLAFMASAAFFYVMGSQVRIEGDGSGSTAVIKALELNFNLTPWLLAIPLMVILFSVFKRPILWILTALTGLCSAVAISVQGQSVDALFETVLWGYRSTDVVLGPMLKGGGLIPFLEVLIVVTCAIALSSMLEMTTSYQKLSLFFLERVKDKRSLRTQIGLMSIVLTSVTCDQTIGIVTPAQLYKQKSEVYGLTQAEQAAAIGDTGVVIAPLEPWNVNALVITAMTGLSVLDYGGYTIFLILLILFYFFESILIYGKKRPVA